MFRFTFCKGTTSDAKKSDYFCRKIENDMNYSAYLFDFDYTLADSSTGIVKCFRIVLERHGFLSVSEEAIRRTIGKTLEESFAILTGEHDAQTLKEWRSEYTTEANRYMNVNTRLYPDTLDTLRRLKADGARIGIISTKYRYRILDFFSDKVEPDFIDLVVGGEDVTHAKPHPEGLLAAMDRLGVSPSQVLYVGDSTVDALTAQAADTDFAGVLTGATTRQELEAYPHTRLMNSLAELMEP